MKHTVVAALLVAGALSSPWLLAARTKEDPLARAAASSNPGRWTLDVGRPAQAPDVLFIPTPQHVVEAMLTLAEVKAGDVVYDLGSGDGRIVITAAKQFGARGVGIDIDPEMVKVATENARAAGVSERVRFMTGNIFTADIHDATVVTLYLLQSLNERLRPKLVRELKPGSRVVSHVFNMGPEWPPQKTLRVEASPIFLWTIPEP